MTDPTPPRPLWRNVGFTLMWTSVAASGFGDRIIQLAALVLLGGFALEETSNARVSINAAINFWFYLPYVVLCIGGGWLADRLPRKWLLVACDHGRALLLVAAFLMLGELAGPTVPESHFARIYAVLFAVGCLAAIFSPTKNAIVPQVIPTAQLQPANAILISIATIASMIGLLLGGLAIDETDGRSVRSAILLSAGFYAVSGVFLMFLKARQHAPHAVAEAAAPPRGRRPSAVRYIAQHRRVVVLIVLTILVWGAAMIVFQSTLSLTRLSYGLPPERQKEYWSVLATALGVGMIAGALVVAAMRTRRESDAIIFSAVCLAGVCTFLLATVPSYWLGLVLAFGVGLCGNVVIITVTSLLQSIAPDYIRGRVMGVTGALNTVSNVLINLAIWHMPNADRGILVTAAATGVAMLLVGGAGLVYALTRGPHPLRMQNLFWRLVRLYVLVWHRLEWRGRHRVPSVGPVILAPNHTTGLDPLLIQAASNRPIRWLMYTSYRFKAAEPLWRAIRPITMELGASNTAKIRQVVESLDAGDAVGFFPEGRLQRDIRELQPLQPGIAMITRRSGAKIVPVWISGTPQRRNMLWHFLEPTRSRVVFGQPYTPDPAWDTKQVLADLERRLRELSGEAVASPSPVPDTTAPDSTTQHPGG